MKNEIKVLLLVDLDTSTKHVVNSLKREGYEIISDLRINEIKTYRLKKKVDSQYSEYIHNYQLKGSNLEFQDGFYSRTRKSNPYLNKSELAYLDSQFNIQTTDSSDGASANTRYTHLVEQACNYLTKEMGQKHSLDDLSRQLLTNRNTLSKAFKQVLGIGVFEWLRQQRMTKASALLRNTGMCIQLISYEVGYNDQANFSTAFKKFTGASPKQYRSEHMKKS